MRPTGSMAECMWTIQKVQTAQPIVVSLGSPFPINAMLWAKTCVNAYTATPQIYQALDKALFGEIPFAGRSPVELLPVWEINPGFLG